MQGPNARRKIDDPLFNDGPPSDGPEINNSLVTKQAVGVGACGKFPVKFSVFRIKTVESPIITPEKYSPLPDSGREPDRSIGIKTPDLPSVLHAVCRNTIRYIGRDKDKTAGRDG